MNSSIEPLDVDVVVPVRDGARFLPACLESIAAQTLPPRAVIVVDDGSTNSSPQILVEYERRWPSLQIIRSEPRGVSHARNLGLSASRASFVAFLDADDVWETTKLERQMALFAEDPPRLGFVHCAYRLIDETGGPVTDHPISDPQKRGDIFSELLSQGNIVSGSGSAVVVRRKLLDLVGGFDERLFFGEDWDLWLRLASISEIDFVPERLVALRVHKRSAQRRQRMRKAELFLFQELLILDRWYGTEKFLENVRERYREVALNVATMRQRSYVFSAAKNDWCFYTELRHCGSRLGRELFSGPVDFLGSLFFRRLMTFLRAERMCLRRLTVSVLKTTVLRPAKFGGPARVGAKPPKSKARMKSEDGSMRLLFCCEHYYPAGGGVAEVMRQIAERLVLRGHHVTVATSGVPERTSKSHNGVYIQDFEVSGNLALGMSGEVDRYRDFVLAFDADALLIKAAQQWTFDALWPVLDRVDARKVFVPCGFSALYEPAYAGYFAQMPQVLRRLDHLIFYAQSYRDIDFARAHGLDNFSVLPNGASELEFDRPSNSDFRDRHGISDDEFVFLSVGSPIYAKGHRQIAEAFARLDTGGRRATLILNGDWAAAFLSSVRTSGQASPAAASGRLGPLRRRAGRFGASLHRAGLVLRREGFAGFRTLVERRLERRRLARETEDWIRRADAQNGKRILRTNLPRPDLVKAYGATDLFVFASAIEYSPLVLFEAVAAGAPFLSVPVGNAEEIAMWTGGGVICAAARDARGYTRVDPEVLAREMQRLLDDSGLRERLGRTGKERWHREFTWQSIAPRYEAILRGPRRSTEGPSKAEGRTIALVASPSAQDTALPESK